MRKSNELQIGKAGEYLVCADLIIMGFIAYPSEQGLPYDIVVDNGYKLLKCQVKTTIKPRNILQRNRETKAYIFNVKRHGKNNTTKYTDNEVDFFALCELENKTVIYIKNEEMPETINIRVDYLKGSYYDEKGIADYEKAKHLYSIFNNMSKVANKMGIHVSQVSKYLKPNYKPFRTNARYWSEFKRDKEWFLNF